MKLRSVALIGVVSLAVLGLIGVGAHAVFTTSTTSGQSITAGNWVTPTTTSASTVSITYPVNNTTYSAWTNAITGTASAVTGSTISEVEVSVEQVGDSCWTGSGDTYTETCPNYVAVTTGTTSWSLSFPSSNLSSGDTYKVTAQATDSSGNVGTSSTVTFTYNTALPTVTITYPSSGANVCACSYLGKITGTASSNSGSGTTISSVSVAIENTTTSMWWNGINFTSSTETFVEPTGTTSWSLPLGGSSLANGDAYSVIAEATDSLGNLGTSSTASFTYCLKTSPPSVTITDPIGGTTYGSNWNGEITGSASATTGATITSVSVAIEDLTTKSWWNGSGFASSTEMFNKASGMTTWAYDLATTSLTSGNSYAVVAQATDSLNNTATSSTVNFGYLVNTAPPTVAITYPQNNTTYGTNWTGTFTGNAAAGPGATISKTFLSVEDTTTKLWWNGSAFTASTQAWVQVVGTTTWYTLTVNLTSNNTYAATAKATDNLGNTGTSSTVTFTYATPPPTVNIAYPVTATAYGTNWAGSITGSASSNSGSGTTISGVSVAVANTTTGKWLVGTSFTGASQSFQTASGTTGWSLALLAKYLVSGDAYSVVAQATDSDGNTGTSSTVTFTYGVTTSPPTVTVTYPMNNGKYGSNWAGTITGTASSNSGAGTTITGVGVAVENTTNKRWWNGTSFSATSQTYVAVSGSTTSWSLPLATTSLTSGDKYSVIAQATDSLKNLGTSSTVSFTYCAKAAPPTFSGVYPSHMGDCGGPCSTGIWWTITGTNFVSNVKVSFPRIGPSADFSIVSGSVTVIDSTTIVLQVRDTGATKGKATVVVNDPGEAPALGSVVATGKPDPTSVSIIGPSTVAQAMSKTLRLRLTGSGCASWGSLAVYFSNPGITGGEATCSGYSVSVPISVSASALTGDTSVTLVVGRLDFALSTNGLTIEVSPHG